MEKPIELTKLRGDNLESSDNWNYKALGTTFMEDLVKIIESNSSRYWVIFWSVSLENLVTETLARILNIEVSASKSIGFSSGSISFHQKVLLIKDIKDTPKEVQTKFGSFMTIRNKFAHVSQVDSFKNYFAISKESEIKKNLNLWYSITEDNSETYEAEYRNKYFKLFNDLMMFLIQLNIQHIKFETQEELEKQFNKDLIEQLKEKNRNTPITIDMWEETIHEVIENMKIKHNRS